MFDCSPHFLRLIKYLTQNKEENLVLKKFLWVSTQFFYFLFMSPYFEISGTELLEKTSFDPEEKKI